MKKLTFILASALLLISVAVVSFQLAPEVAAAPKDEICEGIGEANSGDCGDGDDLSEVFADVINIFSVIIGIVAVIMIMVAGFKYITAAGDSSSVTSAKHTLIYAIVGLVIVAFSQAIVQFVLKNV
jgi:hypothetical protein